MSLAKIEAKIALEVLLSRTEHIELADPDADISFLDSFVHRGICSLQIKVIGKTQR